MDRCMEIRLSFRLITGMRLPGIEKLWLPANVAYCIVKTDKSPIKYCW